LHFSEPGHVLILVREFKKNIRYANPVYATGTKTWHASEIFNNASNCMENTAINETETCLLSVNEEYFNGSITVHYSIDHQHFYTEFDLRSGVSLATVITVPVLLFFLLLAGFLIVHFKKNGIFPRKIDNLIKHGEYTSKCILQLKIALA
jgi:hypothetical protein